MLRRVNAALFEAPAGARIEVVAQSQNNDGVNDARFEYAGRVLPREIIQGLPGCSFRVAGAAARLQAVVAFSDMASGAARYNLAEVENGVLSDLDMFTMKSDGSPLIDFTIDPITVAARVPTRSVARKTAPKEAPKKPARKKTTAKKSARAKRRPVRKSSTPRRGSSRKRR